MRLFRVFARTPDTAAAKMAGQVHYQTKERRVRGLYETQRQVSQKLLSAFVGKKIRVLCEGIDYDKQKFSGRAYFSAPEIDGKVYFNAPEAEEGKEYEVRIEKAVAPDLFAATENYQA